MNTGVSTMCATLPTTGMMARPIDTSTYTTTITIHAAGDALKMRHASLQNETPAPAGTCRGTARPGGPPIDVEGSGGDSVFVIVSSSRQATRILAHPLQKYEGHCKIGICNHICPVSSVRMPRVTHGRDSRAIAGARQSDRRHQRLFAAAGPADPVRAHDDGRRRRCGTGPPYRQRAV